MDCRVWVSSNPPGNAAKVDITERCGSAWARGGPAHASAQAADEVSAPAVHVRRYPGGTGRVVAGQLARQRADRVSSLASAPIG
jgi:hypothetical protein